MAFPGTAEPLDCRIKKATDLHRDHQCQLTFEAHGLLIVFLQASGPEKASRKVSAQDRFWNLPFPGVSSTGVLSAVSIFGSSFKTKYPRCYLEHPGGSVFPWEQRSCDPAAGECVQVWAGACRGAESPSARLRWKKSQGLTP